MQALERERWEDEEDDFTVVDQHGKVYNKIAGMDGIVVQIEMTVDYFRIHSRLDPEVLDAKLLRRFTGGYEVLDAKLLRRFTGRNRQLFCFKYR